MINDNINSMIMTAMKAGEKKKAETYRLIKAKFLEAKTAKNAKPLDEAAEFTILNKMVNERKEDAKQYEIAGRFDLAVDEMNEANIIEELLPKPASMEDIENCVLEYISKNGQYDKKSMGVVIKYVKSQLPTADGKIVSAIVMQKMV